MNVVLYDMLCISHRGAQRAQMMQQAASCRDPQQAATVRTMHGALYGMTLGLTRRHGDAEGCTPTYHANLHLAVPVQVIQKC